jgi:hypothetical protein
MCKFPLIFSGVPVYYLSGKYEIKYLPSFTALYQDHLHIGPGCLAFVDNILEEKTAQVNRILAIRNLELDILKTFFC